MSRDYQRSRVYAWECGIPGINMFAGTMELDEVRAFVARVWRAERGRYGMGRKHDGALHRGPEILDGRGRRSASGGSRELRLPRWSRNPWVVLHETAHGLVARNERGGGHGPRFVGCLIGLAARHMGLDRDALVKSAQEADVDVDVRSIGATPRYGWHRRAVDALKFMGGRVSCETEAAVVMGCGYLTARGALLRARQLGLVRRRGKAFEVVPCS